MIRPGGSSLPRFGGDSTVLGILDTGFMLGIDAPVMHRDLNKLGCGFNFTTDAASVYDDQHGHGTHVLATIVGTGTADPRYRGVAPGVGTTQRIRAGKVFDGNGQGFQSGWSRAWTGWRSHPTATVRRRR